MEDLYYVGFYMLDEFEKDYIVDSKDPPKDIFRGFFNTKKISDNKYLILEIIISNKFWCDGIQVGDVIEDFKGSMLNYTILRNEQEIPNNGIDSLYIIKNTDFKCFYDLSVGDLIDKLYDKLNNYDKLIGINPYSKIFEELEKYYEN